MKFKMVQLSIDFLIVVKVLSFSLLLSFSMPIVIKSDCNYFQKLESGKSYYAYNPDYPNVCKAENHCTWNASSSYVTKINCSTEIAGNCQTNRLNVTFGNSDSYIYCGNNSFVLKGLNPVIKFDTLYNSKGSGFLCEIRAEEPKSNCRCGWKNPNRIVGGDVTGINEYPMMAGLVDIMESNDTIYCGATIISQQYVLTAAHCVESRNVTKLAVVVGEHDVKTGSETSATKVYRLINCIIHPDYKDFIYNDIAICEINSIIKDSNEVGPACLPFHHDRNTSDNATVIMLGWGLYSFGGPKATKLQKVNVQVISRSKCQEYYNVGDGNICTYEEGKDACQMDSGGPVLWQDPATHNLVLIGIIASGVGCATDEPAVNTRVGAYIDWITSVTSNTSYCKVE